MRAGWRLHATAMAAALALALGAAIGSLDAERLRAALVEGVREATGHELTIGAARLDLSIRPRIVLDRIAGALDADDGPIERFRVERVEARLQLPSLLLGQLHVLQARVVGPEILLRRTAIPATPDDAVGGPAPRRPRWLPVLDDLAVENLVVRLPERDGRPATRILVSSIRLRAPESPGATRLDLEGEIAGGTSFVLALDAGSIGSLLAANDRPWPIAGRGRLGGVTVAAEGAWRPAEGGIELGLALSAAQIDDLLPADMKYLAFLAPADLTVRVVADRRRVAFEQVRVTTPLGRVDGTAALAREAGRQVVRARLSSEAIALDRVVLPPPAATTGEMGALALPDNIALDLQGTIGRLSWRDSVVERVEANAAMAGDRVDLRRLAVQVAGGQMVVQGSFVLGGTGAQRLSIDGRRIDLADLQRLAHRPVRASGPLDMRADLTTEGLSPGRWLAGLGGRVAVRAGPGRIDGLFVDVLAADLARATFSGAESLRDATLHCVVGAVDFTAGQGELRAFLLDTERMTITGAGTVDGPGGQVDLRFVPRPKDPSLISLAMPLVVRGSAGHPVIYPEPKSMAFGVALGAAAYLVNRFGVLLPFMSLGRAGADRCSAVQREINQAPIPEPHRP